jgi:hypothetical protein
VEIVPPELSSTLYYSVERKSARGVTGRIPSVENIQAAALLNAPYILQPFLGRINRVFALLDNITMCDRVRPNDE